MADYESPFGWHDVEVKGFEEIEYVLEGEVQLVSEMDNILARTGDAFLIEEGDKFRWHMLTPGRMIFFIYPLTSEITEVIESFC